MNYLPRVEAATTANWPDLVDELDRWGEAGRVAALWWRDDDAVAPTGQLDKLLRLADGIPMGLAVIPALAEPALLSVLQGNPHVALLQHGWLHANRAEHGKKSEYPESRSKVAVATEIAASRARLKALFGDRALPVLVPPWNRFADEFLPLLPASGIAALSAMESRKTATGQTALKRLDAHIDVIAWGSDRGFVGTAAALSGLLGRLRAARLAAASSPPIGILTHHLVTDEATIAFVEQLIAITRGHAAVRWAAIGEYLS